MTFKYWFIICFLLGSISIQSKDLQTLTAQSNGISIKAAKNDAGKSHRVIPFQLSRNLMVVRAHVNGKSGYFILDTGAETLILNEKYFTGSINNQSHAVDFAGSKIKIKESMVQFGWELNDTSMHYAVVIDLSSLEKVMGSPILGTIGYEVLKDYEVFFDLNRREITLSKLDDSGNYILDKPTHLNPIDSFKLYANHHKPYIIVEIAGKKLKFGIDTGAAWSLIRKGAVKKISRQFEWKESIIAAGYNGEQYESKNGIIKGMNIDKTSWNPIKVIIGDKWQAGGSPKAKLDGLLGYEFIKQRNMGINFIKGQVYFTTNPDNEG